MPAEASGFFFSDLTFPSARRYLRVMDYEEFPALKAFISQFIEVTDEEWRWHREKLSVRQFRKGELLLREGQVCNHVSFMTRGCVRSFTVFNDREVTNYFFFENEYATDYCSFLTRRPSSENLQAIEDVEVVQLNHENMNLLYEKIPAWQKFGRLIAEYVFIMINERSRELLYLQPEDRYLKLLRESPQVLERIPQQYIASYLGVKPESLSRIRKRIAMDRKS